MTETSTVLYQVEQQVATITMNRPERRNALTSDMLLALKDAFDAAAADADIRAVLLTGAGHSFCAGQDLSMFRGVPKPAQVRDIVLNFYKPLVLAIVTLEKPVLGAINGAAAGAGASLALACDLRIMADDAFLMQAFSNIGLIPDAGSSWFLVRQLGYSRAFELVAEAQRVDATRCLALGLTNRVAAMDALPAEAEAWAQQLAQRPTRALGWTKQAMRSATVDSLDETMTREAELQAQATQTADHAEGVAAFLQKRPANFTGN